MATPSSGPRTPLSPENIIPFEEVRSLVRGEGNYPDGVAALIARYTMQRFDDRIFGPAHWLEHYRAIPVILPSVERLRDRVQQHVLSTGLKTPKPVEEMRAEECANWLGILGEEDHSEIPEDLHFCLNNPVRPGENVAGLTCAVTYIPEYIRRGGKVMAVTSRTLNALVTPQTIEEALQPNPKLGFPSSFMMAEYSLNEQLREKDADGTQPPCYFVVELDIANKRKVKRDEANLPRGWEFPETRNFAATVFTRCSWKGQVPLGRKDKVIVTIHGQEIGKKKKTPIVLGVNSSHLILDMYKFFIVCAESESPKNADDESSTFGLKQFVLGSKKFPTNIQTLT